MGLGVRAQHVAAMSGADTNGGRFPAVRGCAKRVFTPRQALSARL